NASQQAFTNSSSIVIETYVHIVNNSSRVEDGYVSNQTIADQLTVMNARFSPSRIAFSLKGITRAINGRWAVAPNETDDLAMRKTLRTGDYKALNLYIQADAGEGLLGECYYPDNVEPNSDDFFRDGCKIKAATLPGGADAGNNRGITTVHEVGHWFGLMHTFEGGCEGNGDFVDDTPAEKEATYQCTVGLDTCPDQPGLDSIHNYMAYTNDDCIDELGEFTPGQIARMHAQWSEFR
ncbi:extracellular metalloprotease NCU07200, partial [Immersiella caudata]